MATAASASFTVILADRNRHIRDLLAREFTKQGFTVKGCGFGRDAAELAARGGDLLVADCELPDMDAASLIRKVRRVRPRLPVAVHAHCVDDVGPCLDEPLVYFVPRGDDPAQLVEAVRGVLQRESPESSGGDVRKK